MGRAACIRTLSETRIRQSVLNKLDQNKHGDVVHRPRSKRGIPQPLVGSIPGLGHLVSNEMQTAHDDED